MVSTVPPLDPGEKVPCPGTCTSGSPGALECLPWNFLHLPFRWGLKRKVAMFSKVPRAWNKSSVDHHSPISFFQDILWLIETDAPKIFKSSPLGLPGALWLGLGLKKWPTGWVTQLDKELFFLGSYVIELTKWCWHADFVESIDLNRQGLHKKYLCRTPHILSFFNSSKCPWITLLAWGCRS